MNRLKIILAAIPLVVGLSGAADAALSDSDTTGDRQEAPRTIDSLLHRYSGLTPGDHDSRDGDDRNVPPSRQLSGFTEASSPMSSYYMVQGGDHASSLPEHRSSGVVSGDASAPTARSHTAHSPSESLGAVAGGISPTGASGSSRNDAAEVIRTHDVPGPGTPYTPPGEPYIPPVVPPIIPANPVPLPAAIVLIGSGLAALAPLRKRPQKNLV
jgi:hypothetical protein